MSNLGTTEAALGELHYRKREYVRAAEHLAAAVSYYKERKNLHDAAAILERLALVHVAAGQVREASECRAKASEMIAAIGQGERF